MHINQLKIFVNIILIYVTISIGQVVTLKSGCTKALFEVRLDFAIPMSEGLQGIVMN